MTYTGCTLLLCGTKRNLNLSSARTDMSRIPDGGGVDLWRLTVVPLGPVEADVSVVVRTPSL